MLLNKDNTTTADVTDFYEGETVQLKATPDPGETGLYAFDHWKVVSGGVTLSDADAKMEYSDGATVAQQGGSADNATQSWRNGDFMCNMLTGTPKTFTVTAEDGQTSVDYTIIIKTAASVVPQELTVTAEPVGGQVPGTVSFTVDGKPASATQFSDILPGAKVSVKAETRKGFAFNKWVFLDEDNKATNIPLTEGTLTSPSISFVMPEQRVQVQALFKAETEETGTYTIEYQGPKGGTLIPDKTTANAGDTITVTVAPDEGYQIVAGSLTYTEAVTGGATNNIDESKLTFTMPANNVTLSCRWEEIDNSTTISDHGCFSRPRSGTTALKGVRYQSQPEHKKREIL